MPSAVEKRAACHVAPWNSPTVRSVPGPAVVQRVEAALGQPLGDGDERVGARPSRPRPGRPRRGAARAAAAPRAWPARPPARGRGARAAAQASVGPGRIVQLSSRRLTTSPLSRIAGSRSRPVRTGSRSSSRPGATGPESVIAAPRSRPMASMRSPYHGGTYSSVSSAACAIRARLIHGSNHARVDELRALLVGPLGDRPHQPLLARRPAQRDDLSGLQVGPEVDGELGEACKGGIVHGTASLAGARMQPVRATARAGRLRRLARGRARAGPRVRDRAGLPGAAGARRGPRTAAAAGLAGAGRACAACRGAQPSSRARCGRRPTACPDDLRSTTLLLDGDPAREILHAAREGGHDAIVLGSRGRGRMTAALLGSVSNRVMHDAEVPVIVIHRPAATTGRTSRPECARSGAPGGRGCRRRSSTTRAADGP